MITGGMKMYGFISDIIDVYTKKHKPVMTAKPELLSTSLDFNLEYVKRSFDGTADLTVHEIRLKSVRAAIISIDNMVSKDMLSLGIMKPLLSFDFPSDDGNIIDIIRESVIYSDDIKEITSFNELFSFIMSGYAVIAVDGSNTMLSAGIQGFKSRGISEPDSDIVRRGSKEGFVEPLHTNMALLRRRLKTTELRFEILNVGEISKTEVCICYLNDRVSPEILSRVKARLHEFDTDTALAAGYLVPYLEEKGRASLFSTVGITERPDTLCGKLTEGRIGIILDGVPCALMVPYLFAEYFQTIDDYSNRPYFAFFTRWLKYAAFFVSLMLPGVYVALGIFNPEMFPSLMLNKIAGSIAATPLSLMTETVMILLVYEVMRESGLRMPQPLGYAVSIVGGLVVGDTAVSAGLIGAPTLMVVAAAAICSYIIPDLYAPVAVLRLLFTIFAGICGIWGVAILFCIVFVDICSKNSYGIPYTSPVTPWGVGAVRDVFTRAGWKTLSARSVRVQNMPGAHVKGV